MNRMTKSVLIAAIAALAVTPLVAKPGSRKGTNILHFNARVTMVNDGTESNNATGTVTVMQATQGNADKQTLTVTARGLNPNSPYALFVSTTTSGLADVDDFQTDRRGNATLRFTNGKVGKNNIALSSNLVPVSSIQEVDIEDTNGPVLTADIVNATSLQFLVKQDISTNSVSALVQVRSSQNKGTTRTTFTLGASGLDTNTDYLLVFDDQVVQTNTSDSRGNLRIVSAPTPTNILDLTSVTVTDTGGTPVTGTAILP